MQLKSFCVERKTRGKQENSFNLMQIIQRYNKMKLIFQQKCISVW